MFIFQNTIIKKSFLELLRWLFKEPLGLYELWI